MYKVIEKNNKKYVCFNTVIGMNKNGSYKIKKVCRRLYITPEGKKYMFSFLYGKKHNFYFDEGSLVY